MSKLISDKYEQWKEECEQRFLKLKENEEELNRIFIDIYGLNDELTPDVADKDITVHRVYDSKDDVPESMKGSNYVRTLHDEIVSLVSYAVGCMFGRYSLDVDGLAYAGGEWDGSKYKTFIPDADNCIPITGEEYFEDDIAQSVGELLLETSVDNKRTGDYLYNLLFGYEVNDKYIEKISAQLGLTFDRPYRVGIIVIDRKYGVNLEQDEHTYTYYTDCLNREVIHMKKTPMYMRFLNKFVLLFEETKDMETEHQIERILGDLDSRAPFAGLIHSTCILGAAYRKPADFGKSYQEAKNLIPKKDILPNPTNKKVISASSMGIYKYMFNSGNQQEIMDYCNEKLKRLEMYDNANGSFLIDTLLNYYMCGFNVQKTAQMMYVHRNSLQYRLKKIEEILEISLDDSMEYLDVVNCILVKRLMFN